MARVSRSPTAAQQDEASPSHPETSTPLILTLIGGGAEVTIECDDPKECQRTIDRLDTYIKANRGGYVHAGGRTYLVGTGVVAVVCPLGYAPSDAYMGLHLKPPYEEG